KWLTFLAAATVAGLMFCYELIKQLLFPHITIWQSHLITIGFTTLLAVAAMYAVSGRVRALIRKLAADLLERERMTAAMQLSDARYRSLFERNKAGVFRSSSEGRFL